MINMADRIKGSCTTILVGKDASLDGSTMIARNDDGHEALDPQRFVVVHPANQPRHYQAVLSGLQLDLPDNPLRYTSIPNANLVNGTWPAAGINSKNVTMSATETITTNPRVLGLDPYVEAGMGEEDLVTLVLPYINSARKGVIRLGELLTKFGTYEPNGIAFSDNQEVWWLETIGGHHWAAVRIPDDAYVVAPNRMNIDQFDFASPNSLASDDLKDFIDENQLNPDFRGYNLRHIFGSASIKDTIYNNPRTWFGQKYFTPSVEKDYEPGEQDLPFIAYANRKIAIEDVKYVLSSHFENTKYDPYGHGDTSDRKKFRPIGINRNHNVHVLQVRNNVPASIAGVQWIAFGANTFNTIVPFYTNVNDTPACYRDATDTFDPTNMYWLSATTALLGDTNYEFYMDMRDNYTLEAMSSYHAVQHEVDSVMHGDADVTGLLFEANERLAKIALTKQTELLGKMVRSGSEKMVLRFSFDD